jgi:hypothetical protein
MHLHIDTLHTYLSRIVPFGFAGAALVAHQGKIHGISPALPDHQFTLVNFRTAVL